MATAIVAALATSAQDVVQLRVGAGCTTVFVAHEQLITKAPLSVVLAGAAAGPSGAAAELGGGGCHLGHFRLVP